MGETCKITVQGHDGVETVWENVKSYRHIHDGSLEVTTKDKVTRIPKEKIKHSYVGLPTNENKIRTLNS